MLLVSSQLPFHECFTVVFSYLHPVHGAHSVSISQTSLCELTCACSDPCPAERSLPAFAVLYCPSHNGLSLLPCSSHESQEITGRMQPCTGKVVCLLKAASILECRRNGQKRQGGARQEGLRGD